MVRAWDSFCWTSLSSTAACQWLPGCCHGCRCSSCPCQLPATMAKYLVGPFSEPSLISYMQALQDQLHRHRMLCSSGVQIMREPVDLNHSLQPPWTLHCAIVLLKASGIQICFALTLQQPPGLRKWLCCGSPDQVRHPSA